MSTENVTQTATPSGQTAQEETPWVAVFRAGKYPQGDYSEQDLDEIVRRYDPQGAHEAPISLDHQDSGPALGWVSQLKRQGDLLLARFRQVSEDFLQGFRAGRYKKPSVEIYKDYEGKGYPYLRAVTFLGVQSPAIKGLPQAAFSEGAGQYITITFQEEKNMAGEELAKQLAEKDTELAKFREAQAAKDQALQEKEAELARFKEKQKTDEEALKAKDAELTRFKEEAEKKDIVTFFEAQVKAGNALPAWKDAGIVEFMQSLGTDGTESLAKFSEKEGTTFSQRDWMKKFLGSISGVVTFREVITSGNAPQGQGSGDAGSRLHDLTVHKMQECKDLNYRQAFAEVAKDNPILAMKHMESATEANNS